MKDAEAKWEQRGRTQSRSALVHAVALGNIDRVATLLKRHTDPNSVDEHGTAALHAACARGDDALAITKRLLAAAADPNLASKDRIGSRPLHCAAFSGSQASSHMLIFVSCIEY